MRRARAGRHLADLLRSSGPLRLRFVRRAIIHQATKRLSAFFGTHRPRSLSMSSVFGFASRPRRVDRVLALRKIVVVSSVMFTFISFWRTAAVVLCDMSSTVYYIGAIVENAIGKAAPWFILAVLLFSYGMRAVYIESCALFVRGGVYRIVKEALGGFWAKAAVSALLFDYVLTGPISGVSAGQYIVGLVLETLGAIVRRARSTNRTRQAIKSWGSVAIACAVTLYFLQQNLLGIHESSGKALQDHDRHHRDGRDHARWSGVTLAVHGPVNDMPTWQPDLQQESRSRRRRQDGAQARPRHRRAARPARLARPSARASPSRCAIRRIG